MSICVGEVPSENTIRSQNWRNARKAVDSQGSAPDQMQVDELVSNRPSWWRRGTLQVATTHTAVAFQASSWWRHVWW